MENGTRWGGWSFALAILIVLPGAVETAAADSTTPYIVVLGIAQDAGAPQAGCDRDCCRSRWDDAKNQRHVASLAIVDPAGGRRWLIDATPDFPRQLRILDRLQPAAGHTPVDGIFLTHAHTGHYTGLIHLGREAIGADRVAVHAMPRMRAFLQSNGPWDQLVRLGNIELQPLTANRPVALGERITITPVPVPHRDEYSETVAFLISGPDRSILYLPDIDRWDRGGFDLESQLATVDVAYLDGSFFSGDELPGRDLSEIPHPLIRTTMENLRGRSDEMRARVRFLHLNHTNPALVPGSAARREIEANGFAVATEGDIEPL